MHGNEFGMHLWCIVLRSRCPFVLDPVDFDFVVDELVDVGDYCGALYVHQDEGGHDGVVVLQGGVGARDRARVDVELFLVLVSLEPMCMTFKKKKK